MSGILQGKVTIVTGGGSGIGRAAADVFAREGARLVIADINAESGQACARAIAEGGGEAIAVRCDVSDEASVAQMVKAAIDAFGGLDCAFNNAGVGSTPMSLTDVDQAEWKRIVDVDLLGVFHCLKHEVAAMLERGGGAIVNNSSNAGKAAVPLRSPYGAAKAGVNNLTLTTAVEFGARGVRANAVCPGVIMTEGARALEARGIDRKGGLQIPMERTGSPGEVAELAAWLLSDRASYVTGQAISVDGGMNACQ